MVPYAVYEVRVFFEPALRRYTGGALPPATPLPPAAPAALRIVRPRRRQRREGSRQHPHCALALRSQHHWPIEELSEELELLGIMAKLGRRRVGEHIALLLFVFLGVLRGIAALRLAPLVA